LTVGAGFDLGLQLHFSGGDWGALDWGEVASSGVGEESFPARHSPMSVYSWRFSENTANYPGWNLAATAAGTAALLDVLVRLSIGEADSACLSCAPPGREVFKVPNSGSSPVVFAERLYVVRVPGTDAPQVNEDAGEVTLRLNFNQTAQSHREVAPRAISQWSPASSLRFRQPMS